MKKVDYLERTKRNHFFIGGERGQKEIQSLKIGVAGLGGMGSNIAEYLARLGVGWLNLADPDTIDVSNINRQVIANSKTVGMSKAQASHDELLRIAPDIDLQVFDQGITQDSVEEFVAGCDFIVDEIDVFPLEAHEILHRECRKQKVPVYSAYVVGLGVHFYKFEGDEFTFEDFISGYNEMDENEKFNLIVESFLGEAPCYLGEKELESFKQESLQRGVPIFGPSCLVGHSIVVSRILCDFLGGKVLGHKIPKTPSMPEYLKIDFTSMQLEVRNCLKDREFQDGESEQHQVHKKIVHKQPA
ncbi:MAG: hypothetical protein CME65_06760 [Halobacteriovoraceae bacterium]|nr:hypothetical protein [Halobacteriovoraceae bacterium]|tara:strand:- start:5541 stop:6443 length:903 start_codon:yes stop_codon:yes gene_type:complete